MKRILSILLLGIILCSSVKILAQSRNVYWIHGFSGDASSLEPHDLHFKPLYYMNSSRPVVSTTNGIQAAARELSENNRVRPDANNRNIMIAHSMGGVNCLWLHKLKGSSYVGGLVSMGSPYKGAYAANNILNGNLDAMIADGIKRGAKGIRSEPAVSVSWLAFTLTSNTLNGLWGGSDVPTSLFDVMNECAREILTNILKDQASLTTNTLNSLKVGGSDMTAIQQYSLFTIPSISLYGTENYPATLRFISSRLSRDQGKTVDVVYVVDKIYQSCATFSSAHSALATSSLFLLNPLGWAAHMYLADCWAISRDYWNGGVQAATNVLTGCYRTTTVTETFTRWVPDVICDAEIPYINPGKNNEPIDPVCTSGHWETRTETRTVVITEPGDGLLPVVSPQSMPGCLKKVEIPGMNHEELKYHPEVQDRLNKIFAGLIYTERNRLFFKLNAKQ